MAYLGISAAEEMLKTFFKPGFITQVNEQSSPTVMMIERTSEGVQGLNVKGVLRYGRTGGIGNLADDVSVLPTPNARKAVQYTSVTKNLAARIHISDKLIRASRTSLGAFANMLETVMDEAETDAREDVARQYFGDGSGVLGVVTALNDTSKTLTLTDSTGIYEGKFIDVYDDDTKRLDGVEVIAVNEDTHVITLPSTVNLTSSSVAEGNDVYIKGNKGIELLGLRAYFTAGVILGINRSTYPWFNANRLDHDNKEISEPKMHKCIDTASKKAAAKINLIVTSPGVYRAYGNLLLATKRSNNTQKLQGGWSALEFADGKLIVPENYMPKGTMYFLDLNDWALQQLDEWDWLDRDGSVMTRVADRPIWEASMIKYCELVCTKPRAQVELYNIVEH